MKKVLAFLAFALIVNTVNCQSVAVSFVQVYTHTNAPTPVVNGGDDFQNTSNTFCFLYEHFLKNKKCSAIASYMRFDGCTFVYFEPGGWIAGGGEALAKGFCAGAKVSRFDLGFSYLLSRSNKKFYFKSLIAAGLQMSRKTGVEYWADGLPINGPHYFELEPMAAAVWNTAQVVPSIGFRTGFVFWKRLDIGLGVQGVYAFKPYQKMYLKYQYKGTPQPIAEYESTGTGLFVTFGVGYRFISRGMN